MQLFIQDGINPEWNGEVVDVLALYTKKSIGLVVTTFNVTLSFSFLVRESSQCFDFRWGVSFLCLVTCFILTLYLSAWPLSFGRSCEVCILDVYLWLWHGSQANKANFAMVKFISYKLHFVTTHKKLDQYGLVVLCRKVRPTYLNRYFKTWQLVCWHWWNSYTSRLVNTVHFCFRPCLLPVVGT